MNEFIPVIDDSPTALKKEITQLKRLLKTSNMSLESLRISNQSVRERCRQLEDKLEKEKSTNKSLNVNLHEAAAKRCELDANIDRAEYQIDKLSQRNVSLQKEVTMLTQKIDAQTAVISKHEEQAEIWETAFEQHKAQKLELIEQIVGLERKLQTRENMTKRSAALRTKVSQSLAKVKQLVSERLAPIANSERFQLIMKNTVNSIKAKLKTIKHELSTKHTSKKLEMSKVKRKKYWERSQVN